MVTRKYIPPPPPEPSIPAAPASPVAPAAPVTPVAPAGTKVGEGDKNLAARDAAFRRRRGSR
jgi:hypothetical protein